jgi:hypothetical protein
VTLADEIAAVLQTEAAPALVEAFHADDYALVRRTPTRDQYGGSTFTETTVETGRCRLTVANRLGGERISGDRVLAISLYIAQLPKSTVARETDLLRVNGRTFEITDIKTGGDFDLFAEAALEERS